MIAPGGGLISGRVQEIASQPINVGLRDALIGGFDDLRSFGEAIQALDRLSELGVGLGSAREHRQCVYHGASGTVHREPLSDQSEAFVCLPECCQRPPAGNNSMGQL